MLSLILSATYCGDVHTSAGIALPPLLVDPGGGTTSYVVPMALGYCVLQDKTHMYECYVVCSHIYDIMCGHVDEAVKRERKR